MNWSRFVGFLRPSPPAGAETPSARLVWSRSLLAAYWAAGTAVGLAVISAYQWGVAGGGAGGVAVGWLWAFAAAAAGGLVGFLFGIPKTHQLGAPARIDTTPGGRPGGGGPPAGPGAADGLPRYYVNTNLEDISDWLTKVLVGVTLIQLGPIRAAFTNTARTFAAGLGGKPEAADGNLAMAYAILVYFSVGGFMLGYLATRLFLTEAFRLADTREVVAQLAAEVARVGESVRQVSEKVESAISHPSTPPVGPGPTPDIEPGAGR